MRVLLTIRCRLAFLSNAFSRAMSGNLAMSLQVLCKYLQSSTKKEAEFIRRNACVWAPWPPPALDSGASGNVFQHSSRSDSRSYQSRRPVQLQELSWTACWMRSQDWLRCGIHNIRVKYTLNSQLTRAGRCEFVAYLLTRTPMYRFANVHLVLSTSRSTNFYRPQEARF